MRGLILSLTCLLTAALALPAAASAVTSGQCLLRSSGPICHVWTGKVTYIADADTVYIDVDGDGRRTTERVRITGINATEQYTYPRRASLRRGECHAIEATARLEQLLRSGKMRVRLIAQDPESRSGPRLRRSLAVRYRGRWRDVGRTLLAEGHAVWLPNRREHAWNRDYHVLANRAARAQLNLWDPDYCGAGPHYGAAPLLRVNWDADGDDHLDPNGEWVRITNPDPVAPLALAGWWLRDSALRRFTFPEWATVPPGGAITVYAGVGDANETEFYWGLRSAPFDNVRADPLNMGDGAYLLDPQGDVRASATYPCREACTDPNQGALELSAKYTGRREVVEITNVGAQPIDLEAYRLTTAPYGYWFDPGSVLQPRETMRVRLWEAWDDDDSRLIRYWPTSGPILNNGGDSVQLRRYDDVVIACTAWGSRSC